MGIIMHMKVSHEGGGWRTYSSKDESEPPKKKMKITCMRNMPIVSILRVLNIQTPVYVCQLACMG